MGRTGHDLPNHFDADNALLTWYGKPKTHSAQPLMRKIILSEIQPMFFVRWDNKDTEFLFLGSPNSILSYEDNSPLPNGDFALKFLFSFSASNETNLEDPGPDGVTFQAMEGSVKSVVVNKFERDPQLRNECTKHFGFKCQICGFDFKDFYGPLGKDYCHVHHITPLSEKKSESLTDPQKDLIPVCANCHSMLHRKKPALTPEQLKEVIRVNKSSTR